MTSMSRVDLIWITHVFVELQNGVLTLATPLGGNRYGKEGCCIKNLLYVAYREEFS